MGKLGEMGERGQRYRLPVMSTGNLMYNTGTIANDTVLCT